MSYFKSLLFNFLICFFTNYLTAGVDVVNVTKLPHIGSEIPFAIAMGVLNSLIYPVLKIMNHRVTWFRISAVAFVLNFGMYGILKLLPVGIYVSFINGYLIASFVVTVGSICTNALVLHRAKLHQAAAEHEASMHSHLDVDHFPKNEGPRTP